MEKSIKRLFIILVIICLTYNIVKHNDKIDKFVQTSYNVNKKILYTDLISEYETKFNEQNINRSANIKLAVNKINGTIILPGEIFSYNSVVGNRTEEAGFKLAPMYKEGKIVDGFGGGVCQLSSTVYNACLYANLEIIERKKHQFMPAYIEVGRDATVADGYIDFRFKNTRKNPIKIVCSAKNGILKCQIYGKKEENEYKIEIQSVITEYIPYKTIYQQDINGSLNEQTVIQNGKKGYKCKVYKITKLNGKILSKVIISNDTYSSINEVIKIGTQ